MIRVLLVDDDSALQKIYRSIFPIDSIDISGQAFDGSEAVKIIESGQEFDVILMDQRMPVMSGVNATKKILEMKKDTTIIFLSADDTSRDAAIAAGAKIFLVKPIQLEELINSIKKVAKNEKK
jgi:CheY-like chemotaxis protein